MDWIGQIIGGVAFVAGMGIGVWWLRKRGMPSQIPRQMRRHQRMMLPLVLVACGVWLYVGLMGLMRRSLPPPLAITLVVSGAVMLVTFVYQALRRQTEEEAERNFAYDGTHCGRCEYDLTGNTSGVCPECGWRIPAAPAVVDSAGWALWWRKWEIERLVEWRRKLAMLVVFAIMFLGLGAWFVVYLRSPIAALMPWLMAAQMGINSVRVYRYGRRERRAPAAKEEARTDQGIQG